ncbi:MAG: hypothetical protein KJZ70_08430 [Bryobacterales bacterium]|nr:hypothetical protein [Bryobacterales bacterium]
MPRQAAPVAPGHPSLMAKIKPYSAKTKEKRRAAKMEIARGLPCLLVVLLGMLLLFYLFFLALKG